MKFIISLALNKHAWSVSPINFEAGITKFGVCMHLGMAECCIPYLVTVILISDLVSRIIVPGHIFLVFEVEITSLVTM